jgi:hypothetical protein
VEKIVCVDVVESGEWRVERESGEWRLPHFNFTIAVPF